MCMCMKPDAIAKRHIYTFKCHVGQGFNLLSFGLQVTNCTPRSARAIAPTDKTVIKRISSVGVVSLDFKTLLFGT